MKKLIAAALVSSFLMAASAANAQCCGSLEGNVAKAGNAGEKRLSVYFGKEKKKAKAAARAAASELRH